MIVPMYKYSFLVYHAGYSDFLKEIRRIGVVHINQKNFEPTHEMQELFRHISDVDRVLKKMEWLTPEETPSRPACSSGEKVYHRIRDIEKELEHNHHLQVHYEKEVRQMIPWGDFNWETVENLKQKGLSIRFYNCPVKKYQPEWEEKYYLQTIGDLDGYRYFVKLEKDAPEISGTSEIHGADELNLPSRSLSQIRSEIKNLQEKARALDHELHQMAFHCKPLLTDYLNQLQQSLAEKNALLQTTGEVEGKVQFLEGWVPETKREALDNYLEEEKILYVSSKPEEEDKVPILLKNNRFARLYEVIGQLYDLPVHNELDLVPFFAPFYMMFFGFSLGDAGYGLFIVLMATIAKRKKPQLSSIMSLAQWLGLSTVIFGALTGTFFGINLIEADIPWLENFKKYMITTDQLFNLAIGVGVVQILFGMVLKVVNISITRGFMYSLSTIGWLILIIGSGGVYGLKSIDAITPEVGTLIQYIVLGVSGIFILLLNHPKRNVFINFGAGLWDVYGMTTGLLGDLLSYIRLFALGVSSAILGLVFNSMALSMKPDHVIFGPIVMILILVIGHSITIFMSSLGAFVHPIRLTFVEFYKNAGFVGGGKAYSPFAEPASKS